MQNCAFRVVLTSPIRSLTNDKLVSEILGMMGLKVLPLQKSSLVLETRASAWQFGIFLTSRTFKVSNTWMFISHENLVWEGWVSQCTQPLLEHRRKEDWTPSFVLGSFSGKPPCFVSLHQMISGLAGWMLPTLTTPAACRNDLKILLLWSALQHEVQYGAVEIAWGLESDLTTYWLAGSTPLWDLSLLAHECAHPLWPSAPN